MVKKEKKIESRNKSLNEGQLSAQKKEFFRKAKPKDAKELSKLRNGVFGAIPGESYSPNLIKLLKQKNSEKEILDKMQKYDLFCLVRGKEIIGTIGLNGSEVKGVFVKAKYTRNGIGAKLMNFIERYAYKKGLRKLEHYSAEKAKGFYKKQGYSLKRKISKLWEGVPYTNFLMTKKLNLFTKSP